MANIACVFAHPDDEAFGPGGTIAKLAKDNETHIICCTDGDHQDKGLKDIRAKELLASAEILGVKKVHFLDFVDGELSNNKYAQLAQDIKSKLDQLRPQTIITFDPNGVSGHLDHIAVTSVVNWLFPQLPYLQKIMYFCLRDLERKLILNYFVYMSPGRSRNEVDEIIDISSVWKIKLEAIQKHKSQLKDMLMIMGMQKLLPKEEYFLVKIKK